MTLAKRTLRHPGTRPLAWLLLSAFTTLMVGITPQPAGAQEQEARTAVVLDFAGPVGGALLGRAAAAALQLEMAERFYVVRSRAEVIEVTTRLGLREPFDPDEIRMLYKELDAKQVYTGRVLDIQESDGTPPWTKVLLRVEVYDGVTGDLINGAIVEGLEQGTGAVRVDKETLRNGALERAASGALSQIEARTLLTGSVLQYQPQRNQVLINRGSRAGVGKGMMFDIFRVVLDPANPGQNKQVKVGRLRAVEVSTDDAMAEIVDAPMGIRTNDVIRQVFTLPDVKSIPRAEAEGVLAPPSEAPPRGGKGGLGGMVAGVLGVVAGVGLLLALLSMQQNTNRDAPRVDTTGGAYLQQSAPGQNPSVLVGWGDKDVSPPSNFIGGYVIYRGQSESFAANDGEASGVTVGGTQRSFSDDPNWRQVEVTVPVRFLSQQGGTLEEVTDELDVTIVHTSPQPGQTYFYKVRRIGPPTVTTPPTLIETGGGGGSGGFGGSTGGFGGGSSGFGRSRAERAARSQWLRNKAKGKVLAPGGNIVRVTSRRAQMATARRQVTSIAPDANFDTNLDPQTDNDIPVSTDVGLSDASPAVGPVTFLVPPDLRAPSDNNQAQRIDDVGFEFQGVLGATEYVLQISTSFNFSPLTFQSQRILTTSSSILSFRYTQAQAGFVTLAPNTTYFWRVGAKSTFRNQPAPRPDGYVFSRIFSFTTADQPPTAP